MSGTFTPNGDTWVPTFTEPDDTDNRRSSLHNTPIEAVANQVAWMKRRGLFVPDDSKDSGYGYLLVPLGTAVRNDSTRWALVAGDYTWIQSNISSAGLLAYEVQNPVIDPTEDTTIGWALYLASVRANLIGGAGAGHAAGLPAVVPALTVKTVNFSGVNAALGTEPDPSVAHAGYDAEHEIELDLSAAPVNVAGKRLIVEFSGESGANSVASTTKLLGISLRFTCTP